MGFMKSHYQWVFFLISLLHMKLLLAVYALYGENLLGKNTAKEKKHHL